MIQDAKLQERRIYYEEKCECDDFYMSSREVALLLSKDNSEMAIRTPKTDADGIRNFFPDNIVLLVTRRYVSLLTIRR